MVTTHYYYLKPGVLGTSGFAYCTDQPTSEAKIEVERLPTGRWCDLESRTVSLPLASISGRGVSEQEAKLGLGTYIGSSVCVAHLWDGAADRWKYDTVTGYQWKADPGRRVLSVTSSNGNFDFVYDEELLQDLAVEIYAMRLCEGKPVLLLMPAELRSIHDAAYQLFHARGRTAVGSLKTISRRLALVPVQESGAVPLLDITSLEILQVSAKYALDFVFYHDGGRRAPPSVKLGESIFAEPDRSRVPPTDGTTAVLPVVNPLPRDRLEESDDDSETGETQQRNASSSKRTREHDLMDFGVRAHARLRNDVPHANRPRYLSDPIPSEVGGKGQFRATRPQNTAQIELLVFLPHPAVLKVLFCVGIWDARLSVLHFGRIETSSRRQRLAEHDMCDFSSSTSLPQPGRAEGLDDIIAALDVLALPVEEVYQPFAGRVIPAARKFFLRQKAFYNEYDRDTLDDIVIWIDERLEKIRTYIVLGSLDSCDSIQDEFNIAHESYVQVQNLIRERQYAALKHNQKRNTMNQRRPDARDRNQTKRVPKHVLSALPLENHKKLCMPFLSNQGCRGRGTQCSYFTRGHFRTCRLPDVVRDFIVANYGALKHEYEGL
ncbi:Hypothetical protein PHPALM_6583 [Phytophthora palmivora]|uniref:Uncharacterized protein n=1 Tax=Phytophthora palmivora TaxID=4796 RepID=A0A2P4YEI1_9STRA|nr:Hypothetical protein PHPALM_6583 [Phytophthora palmivora]